LLIDVYVKESIKFADAPRQHRSILELDPRHDGARAYRQLARYVLKHYGDAVEPEIPIPEETMTAEPPRETDIPGSHYGTNGDGTGLEQTESAVSATQIENPQSHIEFIQSEISPSQEEAQ
jgi:hypothetical protein